MAIRIKNLASLEGNTEIDFTAEPLSSAGIFAITGATGAGKSTILDALCLALYGKTPRYLQAREMGIEVHDVQGSTIGQGDVRGILRDGTAEGSAEVDFIGADGEQYRATWSVRRARNKAEGNVQPDTIALRNITSHMDIPGRKMETYREIERLVGLNFEQFTRSVLLAQGDFTAFMKANKDEKSSLLEKLTGTYIYSEISRKIYEKYKVEELRLRDLNIRKEGIDTLNGEALKNLHSEQDDLDAKIEILEKQVEHFSKEITWHEQLAQFLSGQHLADLALQKAVEAKASAVPRGQKLFLVEQAQKTRSWTDALSREQQQHAEKTRTFTALKEHIVQLHRKREILEKQLSVSDAELALKNKVLNDALPQLAEAKKLDTLLSEKKKQSAKAREEAENASKKSGQHQKTMLAKQAELAHLLSEIKTLDYWKTKNSDRRPIAENKDIILSKLRDAHKLLEILRSSTKELVALQEKIGTKETEKAGLEVNLNNHQQEWENLKKIHDTRSKELLLIPIEAINLEKIQTDGAVENIIQAQAHWQLLHSLQTDLEALKQKQQKDRSDHEAKGKTLQQLIRRLAIENTQKTTSELLLQQARLAAKENVGTLRAGLVDNEPCPVCGSTSHPYTEHNPQLEKVLTALEATHQANEETYLSTFRQHSGLEQERRTLEQTLLRHNEIVNTKKLTLETKKMEWDQFNIAQESKVISDEKKMDWIKEKLQALKIRQVDLQAQIQAHASQKMELESDKNKIDQLKATIDSLTARTKDAQAALVLYGEQQTGKNKENEDAALALNEVEAMLSPYFKVPNWMEHWKSEPIPFVERINTFTQKWKGNIEKLEHHNRQQSVIEATLKELEKLDKNLIAEASQKEKTYAIQDKNYKDLIQQRNSIFNGEAAEAVEVQMKRAITQAQQSLDAHREKQQQLNIDLVKVDTQRQETRSELAKSEINIKANSQKISAWIDDHNQKHRQALDMEELLGLLLLTGDWIDTERNALRVIEEEVTKATSILTERKQLLDAHKQKSLSERPLDELILLTNTAKQELEQRKHLKGEISFKLQQNEINKNRIGDLLKDIAAQTAITENWGKLNEIIGSADGKKFRQIAQEYTLDVLLGYANIHLQILTDRYKIERIPATLGLQVVDQDMGDEVRTVYSLSGGESFLVSLALALGLASLSSSRMQVESLFIDEGFGSLDPTTLNIAMDALERLHNQGRKVGVISHVQEMTERIPVQIKVSKMANGKSKVQVVGNYG
ncbi:MAG TPA: AAA family ATPase [Arenibacter sp.]|nr:AAA family ATPase [Arenibacter sp.]